MGGNCGWFWSGGNAECGGGICIGGGGGGWQQQCFIPLVAGLGSSNQCNGNTGNQTGLPNDDCTPPGFFPYNPYTGDSTTPHVCVPTWTNPS